MLKAKKFLQSKQITRPHAVILLLILTFLSGCRLAQVGNEDPNQSNQSGTLDASPMVQPQRNDLSGLAQVIPVTLDAAHKIKGQVNLRLDYVTAPKANAVATATCYDSIAGQLVIGRLACSDPTTLLMDIQAKQVNQICYTKSSTPAVAAKEPIVFPNCANAATLQIYQFNPELKVEVIN
jgi:hypothetical protein